MTTFSVNSMPLSQPCHTFNLILSSNMSTSPLNFVLYSCESTKGRKISQHIANFISSPCSFTFKPILSTDSRKWEDLDLENDQLTLNNWYKPFWLTIKRVLSKYSELSLAFKQVQKQGGQEATKELDIFEKVHLLVMIQEYKWNVLSMLDSLAGLANRDHQYYLCKQFYMLYSSLFAAPSFRTSLQQNLSYNIQELVSFLAGSSIISEYYLYKAYAKADHPIQSFETLPEETESSSTASDKLQFSYKSFSYETPVKFANTSDRKRMISNLEQQETEEELERHERSSTTSASSRANNDINSSHICEVDSSAIFNGTLESPFASKFGFIAKDTLTTDLSEYYDGCFFGDLTITFSPYDKFLLEDEDDLIERRKNFNHNLNFSRTSTYMGQPNHHQNFHYRQPDTKWKGQQYTDYQTKPKLYEQQYLHQNQYQQQHHQQQQLQQQHQQQQQQQQDQKIIPLPLFTLPKGSFMPTIGVNFFNPGNMNMLPVNMAPFTPINFSINPPKPMNIIPEKPKSDQNLHVGSAGEVQSSFHSDKPWKPTNITNITNTSPVYQPSNKLSASASKDTNQQTQKNTGMRKKSYQYNTKKDQDRGDFKLWDKINIQGKLKNF